MISPVRLSYQKPIVPKERWLSIAKKQLKKEFSFLTQQDIAQFVEWVMQWETDNSRSSLMLINSKEKTIEIVIGGDLIGLTELDVEHAKELDAMYQQITSIPRK